MHTKEIFGAYFHYLADDTITYRLPFPLVSTYPSLTKEESYFFLPKESFFEASLAKRNDYKIHLRHHEKTCLIDLTALDKAKDCRFYLGTMYLYLLLNEKGYFYHGYDITYSSIIDDIDLELAAYLCALIKAINHDDNKDLIAKEEMILLLNEIFKLLDFNLPLSYLAALFNQEDAFIKGEENNLSINNFPFPFPYHFAFIYQKDSFFALKENQQMKTRIKNVLLTIFNKDNYYDIAPSEFAYKMSLSYHLDELDKYYAIQLDDLIRLNRSLLLAIKHRDESQFYRQNLERNFKVNKLFLLKDNYHHAFLCNYLSQNYPSLNYLTPFLWGSGVILFSHQEIKNLSFKSDEFKNYFLLALTK